MKIQTFSVVVGGKKCNATCPYCVSKMTGDDGICEEINFRNFRKACQFAGNSGVTTVLLTGKGEPTLYPDLITKYLEEILHHFPFVELQTNGIALPELDEYLKVWYDLGLTTISLSCAHWEDAKNKEILGNNYDSLEKYIKICHKNKLSVRVSCVMVDNYICTVESVSEFAIRCKDWDVEQFTVRPVSMPAENDNREVANWVRNNWIYPCTQTKIDDYFDNNAVLLLKLAHGAKVYDYEGQNISINNCLTENTNPDDIRQLIFFPDGHLRFSWVYSGAILL